MGLSWQQGPLSLGRVGRFLVPDPLPERLLYAEPLRRRMRVRFNGAWIADSEDVVLLHEPGRYPVAYFPQDSIVAGTLEPDTFTSQHRDLGPTSWFTVRAGEHRKQRAAWQFAQLPAHARELQGRVAFAWPAMDAFFEEDERIVGHAADAYHRIDIRQTSRHLQVRSGDHLVADSKRPLVLFESGFAPRWYVPRADIEEAQIKPVEGQTFCPYKGIASYYDIGDARRAAWCYPNAWTEVARISGLISFEPDKVRVHLDGVQLKQEPGQTVVEHGIDRSLTVEEIAGRAASPVTEGSDITETPWA
ncbi:DUF427 domain-containing protein [Bradyrhizobium sp. SYSU BS000235]|uniref:DUF427 domain-containing protein n=1 Tax=Bradyrhizobium sp. SYSU BS000235 TaxID=3411332 RepID=UPI003C720FAC